MKITVYDIIKLTSQLNHLDPVIITNDDEYYLIGHLMQALTILLKKYEKL